MLSDAAQSIVQNILGQIHRYEMLSQTNSAVYLAESDQGKYVVKEIHDSTGRAFVEKAIVDRLPSQKLFRQILHVERLKNAQTTLVIAPYIEGVSFDSVVREGSFSPEQAKRWANDLHQTFQLLQTLPAAGFGRPTPAKPPSFRSWSSFLGSYLHRQRDKAARMAKMRFKPLWKAFERLQKKLDAQTRRPYVINADANARNYLIASPSNRLLQIHMPNVQHGDPAVPYGDAMIHFHDSPIEYELLNLCDYPRWRLRFYAAVAAYAILVFCERVDSAPLEEAVPWGRDRPLLELLDENLDGLKT